MNRQRPDCTSSEPVFFVAFLFVSSWLTAAALRAMGLATEPATAAKRLLIASFCYALTMGWQPIVATWFLHRPVDRQGHLDAAFRSRGSVFNVAGVVGALFVAVAATILATLMAAPGAAAPELLSNVRQPDLSELTPSFGRATGLVAALLATITLVWAQAFGEEVGWRGYFLPRAMDRFGRWNGLVLHGALWGLWYAPILFLSLDRQVDVSEIIGRGLGCVVTCALLGTLFGWLRLASGSVVPAVLANTTLTLVTGLPYLLQGFEKGLCAAALGPPGWIVSLCIITVLVLSKWKTVVQNPEGLHAASFRAPSSALSAHTPRDCPQRTKDGEFLH